MRTVNGSIIFASVSSNDVADVKNKIRSFFALSDIDVNDVELYGGLKKIEVNGFIALRGDDEAGSVLKSIPNVEIGEFRFQDRDSFWRWIFVGGDWKRQVGHLVFSDD